ncbi:MAG: DNA-binding protein [Campylobacteraceae bacterium]|jgi:HTH-type transcriptional regulator/antitoxin HigA|nr:DNA-binding protein [Campylobacteraceae bacterium]
MKNIKVIKTPKEYDAALQRVNELMEIDPQIDTALSDELEVLSILIEHYEEKHWAIDEPDPIEVIKYIMAEKNLKQKDLIPIIGSKSKVSELLNRKIGLSTAMISNLHDKLKIPLEVLFKDISKTS